MCCLATLGLWVLLGAGCHQTPGTAPAGAASRPAEAVPEPIDRQIRVLLLEGTPACSVSSDEAFDLIDPAAGTHFGQGEGGKPLGVVFEGQRIRVPSLQLDLADEVVDLVPRGLEPIGIQVNGKVQYYRGWIRFTRTGDNAGAVTNVVDIEDYLIAVVDAELPRRFHQETFRAQAIAARTYAWYHKQTAGKKRSWDVRATERSQVYRGIGRSPHGSPAAEAVYDTRGLVCAWDAPEGERIFCTYYSSACGGTTASAAAINGREDAQIPPLAGNVQCDFCRNAPDRSWGPVALGKTVITESLRGRYPRFRAIGPIERIEVAEATPAGRAARYRCIDGQDREVEIEAENLRLTLDPTGREIRSTCFVLANNGSECVFQEGRGLGHGVGLCQYGADALARQGMKASQILKLYYPSSRVRRAY
ncbi:MAG: SpoIID/LytB domain-containing protein [Phycisphaerae bacterium]|nr:SpoIID/LytB domain-containing protein [Phycisphaerae bacterium]